MRKLIPFILTLMLFSALTACGHSSAPSIGTEAQTGEKLYNIQLVCAEESAEGSYIITYWNDRVISQSGSFHIHNLNDFPVTVHLSAPNAPDENEIAIELLPEEEKVVSDLKTNESYQVGIHADVKENDEIKILLVDGE